MDFITGLTKTREEHDAILMVTDRLSKMVHIIPTTIRKTAAGTAALFSYLIFLSHGVPESIVSDRDVRFTSHFWQTLHTIWE